MAGDGTPIIIKKKKAHGHAHHGGSWKVAYADFVTAMMAFFMVMWILGLSDESKAQISGYFNDPFGYAKTTPLIRNIVRLPGVPVVTGGIVKRQKADVIRTSRKAIIKVQTALEEKLEKLLKAGKMPDKTSNAKGADTADGGDSKGSKESITFPGSLKELLKHVDVTVTDEGLRVEFLEETGKNVFFDTGSFELKPEAKKVIKILVPVLNQAPDRPLKIEGHTDSRPYGNGASFNNWDLSSARANSLRRALQEDGIKESRFEGVTGYADTHLKSPHHPMDGVNRRVSILIPNISDGTTTEIKIADVKPGKPTDLDVKPSVDITRDRPVLKQGQQDHEVGFWEKSAQNSKHDKPSSLH